MNPLSSIGFNQLIAPRFGQAAQAQPIRFGEGGEGFEGSEPYGEDELPTLRNRDFRHATHPSYRNLAASTGDTTSWLGPIPHSRGNHDRLGDYITSAGKASAPMPPSPNPQHDSLVKLFFQHEPLTPESFPRFLNCLLVDFKERPQAYKTEFHTPNMPANISLDPDIPLRLFDNEFVATSPDSPFLQLRLSYQPNGFVRDVSVKLKKDNPEGHEDIDFSVAKGFDSKPSLKEPVASIAKLEQFFQDRYLERLGAMDSPPERQR